MKTKRDASLLFEPYLLDDEQLLWIGQPQSWRLLSWADLFAIPFSLMWGIGAITWTLVAGWPFHPFAWFGTLFVLAGQYMIWGRFVHLYFRRKHTYYAITSHRALILNRFFGHNLNVFQLQNMASISLHGNTIMFGSHATNLRSINEQTDTQPGFYAVRDVESAYYLLQDIINYYALQRAA